MKKILIILMLCFSANSYAKKCEGYLVDQICFDIKFEKLNRKEDSKFSLKISENDSGKVQAVDDLKVKLWMVMKNGHEHGSDPVKIENKNQVYQVSNVWFLMLGQWQLKISGKMGKKSFDVSVPVCVSKNPEINGVGECK